MTTAPSMLSASQVATTLQQRLPQSIIIRWTSQAGPSVADQRSFVLQVDVERDERGHTAAWIEHGLVRQIVMERTACAIVAGIDHGLTHVDIFGVDGGKRIAAVSFSDMGNDSARPLFARTTLLAEAGFHAGAYDPPKMTISAHRE